MKAPSVKIEGTHFSGHSDFKILTPKQMFQRLVLTLVLAQVKAGTTSENLLNEIRQKKSLKKCITI